LQAFVPGQQGSPAPPQCAQTWPVALQYVSGALHVPSAQQAEPAPMPQAPHTYGEIVVMHRVLGAVHRVPVTLPVGPQQACDRPPQVPHAPFLQTLLPAVVPQSLPEATQRLDTQQPPLSQALPAQQASPGRPQMTPSTVFPSFVPPSGGGAPPVPTGTSTLPSGIMPPVPGPTMIPPAPPVPGPTIAPLPPLPPVPGAPAAPVVPALEEPARPVTLPPAPGMSFLLLLQPRPADAATARASEATTHANRPGAPTAALDFIESPIAKQMKTPTTSASAVTNRMRVLPGRSNPGGAIFSRALWYCPHPAADGPTAFDLWRERPSGGRGPDGLETAVRVL